MASRCVLDIDMGPDVLNMDHATFRQFMIDTCFPPCWEAMAAAKSSVPYVEPILDDATRGGEVNVSCSADNHGNAGCTVGASIRW